MFFNTQGIGMVAMAQDATVTVTFFSMNCLYLSAGIVREGVLK